MKKILLLLFVFYSSILQAQNLVPNWSFEDYTTCPTAVDQADFATGWSKYCINIYTPDYYNACSSPSTVGVPRSAAIYQPDHRNCSAYMGMITWYINPNEREHVGTQLSQPLVIGQKYYLSFYTVRWGGYFNGEYLDNPSNNIGLRLSTVAYNTSNPAPIDNFAHLRSVSVITDTVNWVRISGSIVADSAYNYLILGNFYDDANTDTITQTCGTCWNYCSYYLIDDVCVSTDSLLCNGGIDALPCEVSVNENEFPGQINIFPNPANDYINITSDNLHSPFDVIIFNAIGQQLYAKQNNTSDNLQIDISGYSSGLLLIKIESNTQSIIYKLLNLKL
jgi:hypothetical protein